MELLNRLNKWYQTHCDGSWEHMFGINLETMDNPGWELVVDLADTLLEDVEFQTIQRGDPEDSEGSWIHCFTEKSRYIGRGGIGDLNEIIDSLIAYDQASKLSAENAETGKTQ